MKTFAAVPSATVLVLSLLAGSLAALPATAADSVSQQADSRLASVKAMSEALQREAAKAGVDHQSLLERVGAQTREAEALLNAGKPAAARPLLDASYKALTEAIAGIKRPAEAPAAAPDTKSADTRLRERVERNLATTATMLDALKQQNDQKHGGKGGDIAAIERVRGDAGDALKAGELQRADSLTNEAYVRIKATIASLQPASDLKSGSAALDAAKGQPSPAVAEAARSNYNRRRDSVLSLIDSGKRIATEKKAARPEFAQAEALVKEAEGLAAAGKHADGLQRIERAYLMTRDAIRSLRGGEELSADKNFTSKADEYKYEQARNDDYQGLIGGVIKSQPDPAWGKSAEQARALRGEAETVARAGDFAAALRKIEESTNTLKGILREAGFPII